MAKAVLCILDGFGFGDKNDSFNAVEQANTPIIDYLKSKYSIANIKTSGSAVGLPDEQMGNSEVGHVAIGSGRIIEQILPKINTALQNNQVYKMPAMQKFLKNSNTIHLIGLLSDGGVHSDGKNIEFLANMLKKENKKVFIHAISDGRDCPPFMGLQYLTDFNNKNTITTLCGRFFAMDRDKNPERTELYYNLITLGQGIQISLKEGIESFYSRKITDEQIEPIICDLDYQGIKPGDSIFFCNFRSDRIQQIALKFVEDNHLKLNSVLFMTEYFNEAQTNTFALKPDILFLKENIKNTLSEVLSNNNLNQLHIAETEKYAHVTFFFNGGIEQPFAKEDRILIPSAKVKTYDLKPEMSCFEIIETAIKNIEKYDFIVLNIANCDMVGHTGNFEATKKAVEFVDKNLRFLVNKCEQENISLLITADHGNAECMMDKNNIFHTQHTTLDVPLILVDVKYILNRKTGNLSDIAPTILKILNIDKPHEMTGVSFI